MTTNTFHIGLCALSSLVHLMECIPPSPLREGLAWSRTFHAQRVIVISPLGEAYYDHISEHTQAKCKRNDTPAIRRLHI
ncbi:hypothetical protein BKA66DRAFT_89215 [Pyrenochaeta sp. MPI-SDFR-AT-0127]|nr:hypothetical protein BKA66DRAFT_89215 [Pyrenochaeta sp. MPI-SDFR-AT-0127]